MESPSSIHACLLIEYEVSGSRVGCPSLQRKEQAAGFGGWRYAGGVSSHQALGAASGGRTCSGGRIDFFAFRRVFFDQRPLCCTPLLVRFQQLGIGSHKGGGGVCKVRRHT